MDCSWTTRTVSAKQRRTWLCDFYSLVGQLELWSRVGMFRSRCICKTTMLHVRYLVYFTSLQGEKSGKNWLFSTDTVTKRAITPGGVPFSKFTGYLYTRYCKVLQSCDYQKEINKNKQSNKPAHTRPSSQEQCSGNLALLCALSRLLISLHKHH